MIEYLHQLLQDISGWPIWEQFRLVEAKPSESGSIFGLAEYLASLALFLVVVTVSDFRYSYRLRLTKTDVRKVGFWIGLGVGVALLATDVWFQNRFPVPKLISNSNNVKALLGAVFLTFVFRVITVALMDGVENYSQMPAYGRLAATVDFIRDAIALVEKHAVKPRTFRISKASQADIYDDLAQLIFKTIFAASSVSSPEWTSWSIQHNAVWGDIFGFNDGKASKIIALKVRRLLYDEIKRMDQFANFKGARILGYCLHVLGLTLMDRHKGFRREFHPLQAAVIGWTKANYKRLLSDHPKVAKACLQGSISYESEKHRLAQTYANEIGKEPERKFLELD